MSQANQGITYDEFVKTEEPSLWTKDEFEKMSRKDLRYFAVWNGVASSLPSGYKEQVAKKPMNQAAAALATQVYSLNQARNVSNVRPETHLITNGGWFTYYPKTVEQTKLSGEVLVRNNAPVPAKFGETERYSNLVAVSAFSQTVKVKDGVWKSNVNMDSWNKICGHSQCEISVPGLKSFSEKLVTLLSADGVWSNMPQVSRNGITGEEAVCFVREALGRLEPDVYDYLNTKIVCEVLRTFYKSAGKWAYTLITKESGKRERLISERCYERKKPSDKLSRQLANVYPGCFWYKGGVIPSAMFPAVNGDLKSTCENVTKSIEIMGSDKSTSGILAHMRGYSGLTDDFGKRIQWILGTTLGLWGSGKEVVIRLSTTGDVALLASSLTKWKNKITADKPDKFCSVSAEGGMKLNPLQFWFMLAESKDKYKVDVHYHSLLKSSIPKGAVVVYHNEANLPSARTKGEKPDYDILSEHLVGEDIRGLGETGPDGQRVKGGAGEDNDYVVYTIVYGAVPFLSDPVVQRAMMGRTSEVCGWKKPVRVYSWGSAAKFHGVLTTLPTYQLIGWGMEKLGDTYALPEREQSNSFVSIRPVLVHTQVEWYKKVVIDARVQPFAFLNPISRYSPISNLPFLSKTGLTFSQQKVETEDGVLVGNMVRINREEDNAVVEFVPEIELLDGTIEIRQEEKQVLKEKEVPKRVGLKEAERFVLPASSKSSDQQVFAEEGDGEGFELDFVEEKEEF